MSGATPGLRRHEVRTLALGALGGALEFYDFIVFVYFATVLGALFFPPDMPEWLRQLQTLGIFAAGYLARPIGGVLMAHWGDRIGRKRMFMLSVLLMALPTLAIGLLPTYAQWGIAAPIALLLLRLLQGAAIGGEVPGAWVFVAEHVSERRVGFACATLTAGLTFGILLGSLSASAINLRFTPAQVQDWAWRLPFLAGGALGVVAVWLRRYLDETPVFVALRERRALAQGMPLVTVLRAHRAAVLYSIGLTWLLTAAIVVMILLTPVLMQQRFGLPAAVALPANSIATLCLCVGCLAYGLAADRFGIRVALGVGCVLLAASSYWLYAVLAAGSTDPVLPYAVTGLAVGVVAVVPAAMVRVFPAPIRYSGLSFSYNIAYAVFGGLTPLIVATLAQHSALAPAHYVAAVCVLGVLLALARAPRTPAAG
ncbi:MFS transporter [Chiayiivirga flava]|uniref:MFS family permease n=1 Tax=Chiayiivirga flava TaxID=659595 RepID=A0A7W8D995_9GAMM|nr:MFS transporter [Chiayiivirga flava]MBB5208921.1 MFS family permease [Chiayiivirga flava]